MVSAYKNVKFNPKSGSIKGKEKFDNDKYWIDFSAELKLFSIDKAMDYPGPSFKRMAKLADGFGAPGYFPSGWDWSAVRDSSPEAIDAMFKIAQEVLAGKLDDLKRLGLPEKLIQAMTKK